MSNYEHSIQAMKDWLANYGTPEVFETDDFDATEHDPKCIWTESWEEDHFLTNGFTDTDTPGSDVVAYFVTPRPWASQEGSETVISRTEAECDECDGSGEDIEGAECEDCHGQGSTALDFLEEALKKG